MIRVGIQTNGPGSSTAAAPTVLFSSMDSQPLNTHDFQSPNPTDVVANDLRQFQMQQSVFNGFMLDQNLQIQKRLQEVEKGQEVTARINQNVVEVQRDLQITQKTMMLELELFILLQV